MVQKVNLSDKLAQFQELWSPKAVGAVNDFHVKLVKLKGEFVWHSHEVEDELFLVLQGRLRMQFRDREVAVEQGEFIIVRRSIARLRTTRCMFCCLSRSRPSTRAQPVARGLVRSSGSRRGVPVGERRCRRTRG
jgi:ribosomal protein L29